jgi:hypothetical protein
LEEKMKIEKHFCMNRRALLLSCLSAIFALSSCSKQPQTTVTQMSTPTPQVMEAQSANWKVTVASIRKVPKQPLEYNPIVDPVRPGAGPENKYDTLEVNVIIEYLGPASDVKSPAASLINDKGQKFEGLKAAFHPSPDDILALKNVPSDKISEVSQSAEYKKRAKEIDEILDWIDPDSKGYKKKPRALKTGEKLDLGYSFKDPKEYSNLRLSFEDVPPVTLKAPKD